MQRKGQIVEVLQSSPVYTEKKVLFLASEADFLSVSQKKYYSLFDGILVGEHNGVDNFRLGQRKGINVGGKKKPLFVIGIDVEDNRLFVGEGDSHPGLFSKVLAFDKNKIDFEKDSLKIDNKTKVLVKSDLDGVDREALLYIFDNYLFLEFEKAVAISLTNYNITVFYKDTMLIHINN